MDPRVAALNAGLLLDWDSVAEQVVRNLLRGLAGSTDDDKVLDHE